MKTFARWLAYVVIGLIVLALLIAGVVWWLSRQALQPVAAPAALVLSAPSAAELADAPRQLKILGCAGCHGATLQGNLFFDQMPVAKLYAPNLTRIMAGATDAQLDRAIRQGISLDGRPLLIMPSAQYQYLSASESAALIAAMRQIAPTGDATPPNELGPVGRVGLAIGKFPVAPTLVAEFASERAPDYGSTFAAGRHLVETTCTECHGPRLMGREVRPGAIAPDLAVVAAYEPEAFRTLLRTGVAVGNRPLGLMGEIARNNFQHLRDDEIDALLGYLKERVRRAK